MQVDICFIIYHHVEDNVLQIISLLDSPINNISRSFEVNFSEVLTISHLEKIYFTALFAIYRSKSFVVTTLLSDDVLFYHMHWTTI